MESSQALYEYLRLAKIQELEKKYSKYGFDVETNVQSGKFTFDIIAQKNRKEKAESKYIVVKTGQYSPKQIILVSAMRDYVEKELEAEFELVIANPPRKKDIGFYQFEKDFSKYIIDVFTGSEISENEDLMYCMERLKLLSDNTLIESVTDIEFDVLDVRDDEVFVVGVASINIVLNFDDDKNNEFEFKIVDSYSCSFEIVVYDVFDYHGTTLEVEEFNIDFPEDEG